jgi:hypothetical protein
LYPLDDDPVLPPFGVDHLVFVTNGAWRSEENSMSVLDAGEPVASIAASSCAP